MGTSKLLCSAAMIAGLAVAGVAVPAAAEIEELTISVIGLPSMVNGWKHVQQPFFDKNMPEASGGKVKFDAKPHDQAGIDIKETTRLASDGVINIGYGAFVQSMLATTHASKVSTYQGLASRHRRHARLWSSYRPVAEKVLRDKFKFSSFSRSSRIRCRWCSARAASQILTISRARRSAFSATAMADYMKELGAVTINIPFVEVLPAMQQGVADCGITSPANGNGARWWEVHARDLLIMPVGGWGLGFFAANMDWVELPPRRDAQAFLQAEFKKLEDPGSCSRPPST